MVGAHLVRKVAIFEGRYIFQVPSSLVSIFFWGDEVVPSVGDKFRGMMKSQVVVSF